MLSVFRKLNLSEAGRILVLSPPHFISCELDNLRSLKTPVDHSAETGIDYSFCMGIAVPRNEIAQTFIKATSGNCHSLIGLSEVLIKEMAL